MKRSFIVSLILMAIVYTSLVFAKHFWRGETMKSVKVGETWGKEIFNGQKFKAGSQSDRAKMAFSIMINPKPFLGKTVPEIKQELGEPDGFYFVDMFPAYLISGGHSENDDSWQIVFMLDRHQKVSDIIVHKNCCDR